MSPLRAELLCEVKSSGGIEYFFGKKNGKSLETLIDFLHLTEQPNWKMKDFAQTGSPYLHVTKSHEEFMLGDEKNRKTTTGERLKDTWKVCNLKKKKSRWIFLRPWEIKSVIPWSDETKTEPFLNGMCGRHPASNHLSIPSLIQSLPSNMVMEAKCFGYGFL